MIFVRYAVTDSDQQSHLADRAAIDNSAKELSDEGISQRRISCSLDEIQHVESLLQEQEACMDEAYRTKWKEKSALNGTVFRLSLLRPTLEPLFPHRTAELKRRAEKRRNKRMMQLQTEDQLRKDELQMRLDRGENVDRVCSKPGCEEWALLVCPRCPNACYCRLSRKSMDFVLSPRSPPDVTECYSNVAALMFVCTNFMLLSLYVVFHHNIILILLQTNVRTGCNGIKRCVYRNSMSSVRWHLVWILCLSVTLIRAVPSK